MFQHAQSQAGELSGGRFAATGTPSVTGATPNPQYPAAGAHQSDPVGAELPLGFPIDQMPTDEPSTNQLPPSVVEQLGPASDGDAPSPVHTRDELRPGAGPLFHKEQR
jgi:hypothetical protein